MPYLASWLDQKLFEDTEQVPHAVWNYCTISEAFEVIWPFKMPSPFDHSLFWRTNVNVVWRQLTCVMNYVDQQSLKPDDHYHYKFCLIERLWTFDALIRPLLVTERFLLQPLVYGTVFRRTSLLPPPFSPFSAAVVLNYIPSHFLIPLSDSSLICTVPWQWLVILGTRYYM